MLIEKVFRSDDVPSADRLDAWRKRLGRDFSPLDSRSDQGNGFRAETRLLRLGGSRVWSTVVDPATIRRTPELARRSDPGVYTLILPVSGGNEVAQAGREAVHGPFDMHVLDSSRPFHLRLLGSPSVCLIGADVPKAGFPLPAPWMDRILTRRLPGRKGVGALLSGFLLQLTHDTHSYRSSDGPRLEAALLELLTALFAHHLDADDSSAHDSARRALVLRIQAFIRRHLQDPQLTPPAIAAAHHISVSYLHRLFQGEGITVSSWIREQRLTNARRDLADPTLRGTPIHAIASRWGFPRAADFSRAFRSAYGLPPKDYRHHAIAPDQLGG
ncbi:helix-turn-helix domain-containing protein [Streptomyces ipomoeae]|uniref:helix-turn-helix domain-containing protein n=1 Tax=Streptomyces ipomoeae TaxID=103232 RepID=UPI0029B58190|nr:helix-turn-helix domain-containing protein [Streptomyces ipomoeae]MDX2826026.1 helix-turn-helix domain-containing protein [Streptomyces ipomoeae]MDX2878733.1 helix-turn-helix domain-containing protein [Streptomyces ipomoeae]